ncbi:putative acetyltransferase [Klenkia marina]|uniref:Putative acetyltransferase n=1 Tax=Klenkia marina TaxID=1960309 RepID=A0A1G4XCL1_9ACTN|nr:GNAT family N-acetyltransferase [Klenkia marina]SCX38912.1 putative acetyltransferase [Klenkia marina]
MTGVLAIRPDDLTDPRVRELIALHVGSMLADSPPGTSYALDLTGLTCPGMTVWTAWDGDSLAGMVALSASGELKSMRTHPDHLRRGVAAALLAHALDHARAQGLARVVLETGTAPPFTPAVALYRRHGFVDRGPFGDYAAGPDNQFLELLL